MTETTQQKLQEYTNAAEAAGYAYEHARNTCISTNHALQYFLVHHGYPDAKLVRMFAVVGSTPGTAGMGKIYGGSRDGTRLPKSGLGMWHGHLGVECEGFILDPTVTSANASEGPHVTPLVVPQGEGWMEGKATFTTLVNGTLVKHIRHWRQYGWKSAPAAGQRNWKPIYHYMCGLLSIPISDESLAS